MIILDTHVVSEPMKTKADPLVQAWLDQQESQTLFLTAISLAELLLGLETLPEGKRKLGMNDALQKLLERLFGGRILSFNQKAAICYASLVSRAKINGRSIAVADAQIAATAKSHNFIVATRDTIPFISAGVRVINPWKH